MGQMPEFLQFLQPRIESVLGRFKINAEDLFVNDFAENEEETKEGE